MSTVQERVVVIVAEVLGVELEEVDGECFFADDLGADSLDTVELIMAFEEEFGRELPDNEAEQMATVQDAINYFSERLE